MTVSYLDSKRINGLSTDTKPDSNTGQTNSLFTETDTGKLKWASNNWGESGGWVELSRASGTSVSSIINSSLANKRYYMLLTDMSFSDNSTIGYRFNSDNLYNYSNRWASNGIGNTQSNSSVCYASLNQQTRHFGVHYIANYETKEKLMLGHTVKQNTVGSNYTPNRDETTSKWNNTTDAISSITTTAQGSNDMTGETVVLGWDPAASHSTNFWTELASVNLSGGAASTLSTGTFTNKKYLWVQVFLDMTTTQIPSLRINNVSTGTAYFSRYSNNGGGDGTDPLQNQIALHNAQTGDTFANYFFVNNGTNEPLGISHAMSRGTAGAGYAPDREERVMKTGNTTAITRLDWGNFVAGSGNYGTNSIVKVWGSN